MEFRINFELSSGVAVGVVFQSCEVKKVRNGEPRKLKEILTQRPKLLLDLDLSSIGRNLQITIVIARQVGLDHCAWTQGRLGLGQSSWVADLGI